MKSSEWFSIIFTWHSKRGDKECYLIVQSSSKNQAIMDAGMILGKENEETPELITFKEVSFPEFMTDEQYNGIEEWKRNV